MMNVLSSSSHMYYLIYFVDSAEPIITGYCHTLITAYSTNRQSPIYRSQVSFPPSLDYLKPSCLILQIFLFSTKSRVNLDTRPNATPKWLRSTGTESLSTHEASTVTIANCVDDNTSELRRQMELYKFLCNQVDTFD